jgi:hypothetical protein
MAKPKAPATKVDPELTRQMAAATPDEKVSAVFTLRTPPGKPYLPADETRQTVEQILQEQTNIDRVKVFANTQSFALDAPAAIIEKLTKHPAVAAAIADQQPISNPEPPATIATEEPAAKSLPAKKKTASSRKTSK